LASPEIDVDDFGGKILSGHCRYAQSLIASSCQVGSIVVAPHSKSSSPNMVGAKDEIGVTFVNRGEDKRSWSSTVTNTEAPLQPPVVSTNRSKGKKPLIPLPSTRTTSTRVPSTFSKMEADIEQIRGTPSEMFGNLSPLLPNIVDIMSIEEKLNHESAIEPSIDLLEGTTAPHTSSILQNPSGWPIFA
jgi:hypothetical protein